MDTRCQSPARPLGLPLQFLCPRSESLTASPLISVPQLQQGTLHQGRPAPSTHSRCSTQRCSQYGGAQACRGPGLGAKNAAPRESQRSVASSTSPAVTGPRPLTGAAGVAHIRSCLGGAANTTQAPKTLLSVLAPRREWVVRIPARPFSAICGPLLPLKYLQFAPQVCGNSEGPPGSNQ